MKKIKVLILILFLGSCIDSEVTYAPSIANWLHSNLISKFPRVFEINESINIMSILNDVPANTNWEFFQYINDVEVDKIELRNRYGDPVITYRFVSSEPGEFVYRGCLRNPSGEFCRQIDFTVK